MYSVLLNVEAKKCLISIYYLDSVVVDVCHESEGNPIMKKCRHVSMCCAIVFFFLVNFFCPLSTTAASTGGHVFRGAVSPKPVSQVEEGGPAQKASPPAPAVQGQKKEQESKTKAAEAPKKKQQKSAKATSTPKKEQKSKSVKADAAKKKQKKEAKVAAVQKKEVSKKKTVGVKQAVAGKKPAKSAKTDVKSGVAKKGKSDSSVTKDLHLNVKAAILVNMSNGQVYYEQNPDKTIAPASITKLLTLYLVNEALAQGRISPDTRIPVSAKAVKTGGSRMSLKKGEKVPLRELIKGISVVSANNACVAVAEYMSKGDPSKFVSQMNAKAKKIGMTNSRFKNPNGLPAEGQLSTARDIAKLSMSYLRTFPESLKVHSLTTHTYHGATHRNANSLLRSYKGVDGLKTGFVCASGYNITATAKRGDTRLIAVVLGAQNAAIRQAETAKLLDYGFKRAAMDNGLGSRAEGKKKNKGA